MKVMSPQKQLKQYVESMYPDRKCSVDVRGYRPSRRDGKRARYHAHVYLGLKLLAYAEEYNWRQAYKTLRINIDKGIVV